MKELSFTKYLPRKKKKEKKRNTCVIKMSMVQKGLNDPHDTNRDIMCTTKILINTD